LKYTDEELLAGCRQKKPKFQEALYNQYASRMMGICLRYAYTSFEAEDIFQDAFVKVFQNLESFKGNGSFEGWMKHVFINTAINHYHKNKKRFFPAQVDEVTDLQLDEPDALGQMGANELLALVNQLPEGYKLVFNLYVIEGYPHKDIGEMLGISEGTSKSQLAKAKGFLKKLLTQNSIKLYAS
jgi:RNA polymerase sigma factor (sigma-70 family)